jgi:hypothetical protein
MVMGLCCLLTQFFLLSFVVGFVVGSDHCPFTDIHSYLTLALLSSLLFFGLNQRKEAKESSRLSDSS